MDPFHVNTVHQTYFEYSTDVLKIGKETAQASGVADRGVRHARPAPRR